MGAFIGRPLSKADAQEVARRCSFKAMKSLAPNVVKSDVSGLDNQIYFRSGTAGSWRNDLNDELSALVDGFVDDNFKDSGVKFQFG